MAGALGFITANPVMRGWDQQEERTHRRRTRDQEQDTDTAIREGVGEMLRQPPAGGAPGPASGLGAVQAQPAPPPAPAPAQAPAQPSAGPDSSQRDFRLSVLRPHFEEASRETGIPVDLLIAQATQESGLDPNARGRAGEIGVMQIMPSTAQQPGFGMTGVSTDSLNDPRENILFGARYLRARGGQGVDWANPDAQATALRAYNGGGDPRYVENVRRYMSQTAAAQPAGGIASVSAAGAAVPGAAPAAPPPQQAAPSAPQNPYAPVLSRLTATPGAGAAALNLLQRGESELTRRQFYAARAQQRGTATAQAAAERNIIYALGRGEVEIARQIAARAGIDLPDSLLQNREGATLTARAANLASRYYRNDQAQAMRFTQAFIQSRGDLDAAAQAAGVPAGAPANWRLEMLRQDDKDFLAFVNPRTREIVPAQMGAPQPAPAAQPAAPAPAAPAPAATPQAAQPPAFTSTQRAPSGPLSRPARTGTAARPTAAQQKYDFALRGGASPEEAARIAAGTQLSPGQVQRLRAQAWASFRRQAVTDLNTYGPPRGETRTSEQIIASRVEADMKAWDEMMGAPGQQPSTTAVAPQQPAPAAAASAPAAPQPAARPPQRPANVPAGSAWSASRQQWRDPQGGLYDASGNRVGSP